MHQKEKALSEIWHQVPPDYYQSGVKKNTLQRLWHFGKLKTIIDFLEDFKFKNILDVGCASGWFLFEVSKKFPQVRCVGVDVYKPAVDYGKKCYKNIKFIESDAHKLPFKDNSFDVVICTEVLEHVEKPKDVLNEIKRVLRPKGKAIIEMDSGNILFRSVWYWWTNLRKGVWKDAHIHTFNTNILEDLLKKSGLKMLKKKSFNYSMAVVFLLEKN